MGQPGKAPGDGLWWETFSAGSGGWGGKARAAAPDPIEDLLCLLGCSGHPLPKFGFHFTHLLVGCWL